MVGHILAGSVLLRRPGVAAPGLAGGVLVAAAWLAASGFTFNNWLNSIRSDWWLLLPILAPIVVGVGGTLLGGSAAVGRRVARLATVTAAVGVYLYGVLAVAVAVLGAAGHDPSEGWTAAQVVDDNLGNQATFYLMALPLMTATIGWAAAAATARLRYAQPVLVPAQPILHAPEDGPAPIGTPRVTPRQPDPAPEAHLIPAHPHTADGTPSATPAPATRRRRTWYVLLLCAALAAAAFLVFITFLAPHPR